MIGELQGKRDTSRVLFLNSATTHHHAPIGTTITVSFVGLNFAKPMNQIVSTKDMLPKMGNTGFAMNASKTFEIGST